MGQASGGEILVRALRRQGIRKVFSLPGAELFPVYDACRELGIELITGRHEGAVVQAAEGWARATGEAAVALVAVGPGHANAVGGLATAFSECSPVILLSGIDESRRLGRGARQELPQVDMCAPPRQGPDGGDRPRGRTGNTMSGVWRCALGRNREWNP